MDDKVCNLLNEVDEYFNNRGVNERKFNNSKKLHSYCPYESVSKKKKCSNDYERINALGEYLFNEIMKIDKTYKEKKGFSRHIEVFMMWLGEKLFRTDKDYKATLEESYEKNLENFMRNLNYWKDIDINKLYKKATVKKMSEYYSLLNYICKLIIEYNKNPKSPNRKVIVNYSTQCDNHYKAIHNSINGCRPYLYLLDTLKMIFEIFRMEKIVTNYNIKETEKKLLLNRVKPLETFQGENRYFISVNGMFSFDDKECVEVRSKDEQIGKNVASRNLQGKPKGSGLPKKPGTATQGRTSGKFPSANPSVSKPSPVKPPVPKPPAAAPPPKKVEHPPAKPTPTQTAGGKSPQQPQQKSGTNHQSGTKDSGSNKGNKDSGVSQLGSSKGKSKDDPQKKTDQVGTPSPGTKVGSQPTGVKNQGSGADGQGKLPGGTSSGTSSGTGSGAGGQGGSGSQTKHSGNPPHGNPVTAPSGTGVPQSKPGPKDQALQSQISQPQASQPVAPVGPATSGTLPGTPQSPVSPTTSVQSPDPSQTNSQQTGQQQTDPLPAGPPAPPSQAGGSTTQNEPKDPGSSKGGTGGASGGNGNSGGGVNGGGSTQGDQGNPNGGSTDQGNKSGGSSDPASSTSGGSFDFGASFLEFLFNGTDKFNQASKFVKENHQKFKDAKDKISDAYNNTVDNLKIVYNASSDYFNSVVSNITNQLNKVDAPSKTGSSGNDSPQNSDPFQKNRNPQPLPPSTPPKDPSSNQLSTAPIDPTSQKQPSPQSQPIIQKPAQVPAQVNQLNSQKIGQLIKSLSSDLILKKPWNIFPTTWNGSGDCKPEIKFMNATLVCCTSEQCSLTGITVTLVLIPIILLIAYKYLSLGSSKKSEKKNMKRVINFHDGNRKTKIIISSYDNKKDLKPVINSVGGKKGPLLNIYKLIRADPMPFINLFFLLIFFVYKRKRNTIE
ncbi:PIR protein CIR protein [Plasmodium vinckei lentum]|uniref:PIR protein CIR protein n=1 Tax=Plasmodium vinckei lentum TaxID=138297 RepID=A0A6V7S0T5_PLAVN|nr:PIR protein CIR protein [Plasmodium vinckei lentum]